jgi:hypothetical protein
MPAAATGSAGWRTAWAVRGFRRAFAVTLAALPLTLWALSAFLLWVERRPGAVLDDPVLALLPPGDASVPTFALIYGGMLLALVALLRCPWQLLRALQGYVTLVLLRMLCMWLVPLDPPPGYVPLHDPVVESFGPAMALSRDLFFSGHTSTLLLLALTVPARAVRVALLLAMAAVAVLLLRQHAHYTVDVLVALLAAPCALALARRLPPRRAAAAT